MKKTHQNNTLLMKKELGENDKLKFGLVVH